MFFSWVSYLISGNWYTQKNGDYIFVKKFGLLSGVTKWFALNFSQAGNLVFFSDASAGH